MESLSHLEDLVALFPDNVVFPYEEYYRCNGSKLLMYSGTTCRGDNIETIKLHCAYAAPGFAKSPRLVAQSLPEPFPTFPGASNCHGITRPMSTKLDTCIFGLSFQARSGGLPDPIETSKLSHVSLGLQTCS